MLTVGVDPVSQATSMATGVTVNLIAFVLIEMVFKPVLARVGCLSETGISRKAHSEEMLSDEGAASALSLSAGEESAHIHVSVMNHGGTVITVLTPHSHVTVHVSGDAQKPPTTTESQ
ncbi:MAG: hypothetical protein HXO66_02115 [Rothia sp.]|nr:hypothetical protein [Rothia sp. (in: high G+C Gram-positive bacteria)]